LDAGKAAEWAERNIGTALGVWTGVAEGGAIERTADGTLARVAAPLRAFNQVLLDGFRPRVDIAHVMGDVRRFMGRDRRFRMRVLDNVAPPDDGTFEEAGLKRRGGIPCMALDLRARPATTPDGTDIRSVSDDAMLMDHIAIVAAAFDWQVSHLAGVLRPGLLGGRGWHAFTAYADDAPVAAAQLVIDGECGGLYYIATSAEYRRRGLGEAITRHAAGIAAEAGCTVATLQASPMGEPVYERIGFQRVGYYRTYVPASTV
jgi:ribosomal protein S18 acetylase RimI-like enzyme